MGGDLNGQIDFSGPIQMDGFGPAGLQHGVMCCENCGLGLQCFGFGGISKN